MAGHIHEHIVTAFVLTSSFLDRTITSLVCKSGINAVISLSLRVITVLRRDGHFLKMQSNWKAAAS